jgi:hypothetical protein
MFGALVLLYISIPLYMKPPPPPAEPSPIVKFLSKDIFNLYAFREQCLEISNNKFCATLDIKQAFIKIEWKF